MLSEHSHNFSLGSCLQTWDWQSSSYIIHFFWVIFWYLFILSQNCWLCLSNCLFYTFFSQFLPSLSWYSWTDDCDNVTSCLPPRPWKNGIITLQLRHFINYYKEPLLQGSTFIFCTCCYFSYFFVLYKFAPSISSSILQCHRTTDSIHCHPSEIASSLGHLNCYFLWSVYMRKNP